MAKKIVNPADAQTPPQDQVDHTVEQALAEAQASLAEMQQTMAATDSDPTTLGGTDLDNTGIELLSDVDLHVTIELGRTEMLVEDVLKLGNGSVVELDKLAGDPVDVHVNDRLVARGEVLVLNDNFCIRISEIVANIEQQVEAAVQQDQMQIS
jgi:flagellar motor switch protein FliN/FliY